MELNVDVTPKTHRVIHNDQDIGHSLNAAARWLQANAGANDTDTLISTFDGKPSLRGSVGWYAKYAVKETSTVSIRSVKWRAVEVA